MKYLHTMVRVKDLEVSLYFYCELLGLKEIRRTESETGRYTNVFLAADRDIERASETSAPVIELTYNWPDENGNTEEYTGGRNFGHLAYEVNNIYEFCQNLMDNGVVINRPPKEGKMAFVKSPDGISIELLQKGDPLPIQAPWQSMPNIDSW